MFNVVNWLIVHFDFKFAKLIEYFWRISSVIESNISKYIITNKIPLATIMPKMFVQKGKKIMAIKVLSESFFVFWTANQSVFEKNRADYWLHIVEWRSGRCLELNLWNFVADTFQEHANWLRIERRFANVQIHSQLSRDLSVRGYHRHPHWIELAKHRRIALL